MLDAIAATLDCEHANETWEQAWAREAALRAADYDADPGPPIDAFEAIEDIRQRLKARRSP